MPRPNRWQRFTMPLPSPASPRTPLQRLYQGWIDTVQAFRAATITGGFHLPLTPRAAADREAALRDYGSFTDRIATIRSVATKEKQTSRRADLNMELARLRAGRDAARARL